LFEFISKFTDERYMKKWSYRIAQKIPRWFVLFSCHILAYTISFFRKIGFNPQLIHNLQLAFTDVSKRKIKRIVRFYYYHLFLSLFELLIDAKHLHQREKKIFHVTGKEHIDNALQEGRGLIVYTPHIGNFFYYYWYLSRHYSCLTVATASDPQIKPIYLKFQDLGCRGVDYDDTPPLQLMKELRSHLETNGIVFLLGDFYRKFFPTTHFFGYLTHLPNGAAVISLEHKVPIICMEAMRIKKFQHQIRFRESLHLYQLYQNDQRKEANQHLHDWMESVIQNKPEQWFYWFDVHNRWKENKSTIS
jgi:lauroyl/myristoyl acyltransferase